MVSLCERELYLLEVLNNSLDQTYIFNCIQKNYTPNSFNHLVRIVTTDMIKPKHVVSILCDVFMWVLIMCAISIEQLIRPDLCLF